MCIVAVGRNNLESGRQQRFLNSLLALDYGKLHIVYVDDKSSDGTLELTQKFMQDHQESIRDRWEVLQSS